SEAFLVPDGETALIRVRPGMLAGEVFVQPEAVSCSRGPTGVSGSCCVFGCASGTRTGPSSAFEQCPHPGDGAAEGEAGEASGEFCSDLDDVRSPRHPSPAALGQLQPWQVLNLW